MPGPPDNRPALELRDMTKRYGDALACDGVDLTLRRGEIHGVLGENGAGKTTLMRLVAGLTLPDGGSMRIDGEPVGVAEPAQAAARGIGMAHQHGSLVDALTVWENVELGARGKLDPGAARERIVEIGRRYGLEVDPAAVARDLGPGMRQRVEIVKCLRRSPKIIILDEPTSALTASESERFLDGLGERAREEGWAVALVSHKLDEALAAADRITVMRNGRVVDRAAAADVDAPYLARAMAGGAESAPSGPEGARPVEDPAGARPVEGPAGARPVEGPASDGARGGGDEAAPTLRIDSATARADDGAVLLDGVSLEVRPGEIVGVAGAEGAGQAPLTRVLSSLIRLESGSVTVAGAEIATGVAGAMHRAGVAVIPADRRDSGCVPEMSVAENLVMGAVAAFSRRGVLQRDEIRRRAAGLTAEFGVDSPGVDAPLARLSGGNQQRVVLAQALSHDPKVLVAAQPTRGLDVSAVERVRGRMRAAARGGVAVLLISTDLAEIAALADRVVVMRRGAIVGETAARPELDMERLGLLIGGLAGEAGAA